MPKNNPQIEEHMDMAEDEQQDAIVIDGAEEAEADADRERVGPGRGRHQVGGRHPRFAGADQAGPAGRRQDR